MGILDDAIRQHLDLKRRLGAEDDEIQRLEDEAFGPPTRPGEPDFPETGEAQTLAPETGESAIADQVAPEPAFFDHRDDEPAPPVTEDALAEARFAADDPAAPLEAFAQPAAAAEPADAAPIESLDTVEHHFEEAIEDTGEGQVVEAEVVEDEPASGEEPLPEKSDEDVLEETPEFLRDQPEDDELWFEQGEPKDFDF